MEQHQFDHNTLCPSVHHRGINVVIFWRKLVKMCRKPINFLLKHDSSNHFTTVAVQTSLVKTWYLLVIDCGPRRSPAEQPGIYQVLPAGWRRRTPKVRSAIGPSFFFFRKPQRSRSRRDAPRLNLVRMKTLKKIEEHKNPDIVTRVTESDGRRINLLNSTPIPYAIAAHWPSHQSQSI